MKFRDTILLCILVALILLCVGYAGLRFVVWNDYLVAYEGVCDPSAHNCFMECQNDTCTDKRYYSKMQKSAVNLYAQCGRDITNCEAANECLPQHDRTCSITYCTPGAEGDTCEHGNP